MLDRELAPTATASDRWALKHPAFRPVESTDLPLDQARLTDQGALAVVLQAAGLWAHLEHGGWQLSKPWDDVRITHDGLLRTPAPVRGSSRQLVQSALQRLLRRLFRTESTIAGRGEARRAARYLDERWRQILTPSSADKAVEELLEAAAFLWQETFAPARRALAAEHVVDGQAHLWVAGPGGARRRFHSRARTLESAQELLSSPRAWDLWEGWHPGRDPHDLADRGRWHEAVATWRRDPPRGRRGVMAYARCLFALGRYAQTIEVLRRQHHVEARLLRARAQQLLGELFAAEATVKRLANAELTTEQTLDLVDLGIRLAAARKRTEEIRQWVARGLAETRGAARTRALLLAADAAWDCGDSAAMGRYLEEARGALEDPERAGSWHHRRGLLAMSEHDGSRAVEHVSRALRLDRRRLLHAEAGRLWNDLAVSRVIADDLPGATRAARHAQRLMQDCDGPSRTTLALYNLAEARLRRGLTAGVETILERSTAENRRSRNLRGLVRDFALWVRLELAQGRAAAALARCSEAFIWLDREGSDEYRTVFEVFSARAHGWLGQPAQAAACLGRSDDDALRELEPEERPAVWALAGRPEDACAAAAGTRWEDLWNALAAGTHPPPEVWSHLDALEPYRAARLVLDCELVLPGVVPPRRVRRAALALRACGASASVEKLENHSLSSWRALERYLSSSSIDLNTASDLLTDAGYRDVSLSWVRNGHEEMLLAGKGGSEELAGPVEGGRLLLRAAFVDGMLRVLFLLIRRDFKPPAAPGRRTRKVPRGEIVGASSGLLQALDRLDRLAQDDLPILILGESGTGKELVARRAHQVSRRAEGPFVPINCAELSESLTQSDLFGHVKGSFTGADRNRAGIFESAQSGTVFLDEIGDLPPAAQGKLLRVLQEGEVRRIGESFARKVDVRVITATHRDLEEMVRRQDFRQDLFFRLKVAQITLPPLRDRGRDILLLAEDFLAGREGAGFLSEKARGLLLTYQWPGNVRELHNVLQVAATLADGDEIHAEQLELPQPAEGPRGEYHQLVEQFRRKLVTEALSATDGNRAAAARRLGLTRQALSYLAKQLGLS